MTPWLLWQEPLYHICNTKEDVVFGLKRFRYVASYYAEVMGAASVLRSSPQECDDATGKHYPPITEGETHDLC